MSRREPADRAFDRQPTSPSRSPAGLIATDRQPLPRAGRADSQEPRTAPGVVIDWLSGARPPTDGRAKFGDRDRDTERRRRARRTTLGSHRPQLPPRHVRLRSTVDPDFVATGAAELGRTRSRNRRGAGRADQDDLVAEQWASTSTRRDRGGSRRRRKQARARMRIEAVQAQPDATGRSDRRESTHRSIGSISPPSR